MIIIYEIGFQLKVYQLINSFHFIQCQTKKNSEEIGLTNTKICEVYSSKFFGLSVDNKLNSKVHITALAINVNNVVRCHSALI